MNRRALVLSMSLTAIVVGCVPTLHPIYTAKDTIFDKSLVGTWRRTDKTRATWRCTGIDDTSYRFVHTDSAGRTGTFRAHLARIKGKLFLDLEPLVDSEQTANYRAHVIRLHTFYLVEQIQPELRLQTLNPKWLKNYLKKNPDALAHQKIEDYVVITASTREQQEFVLKHLATKDAFVTVYKLKRIGR